MQKRFENWEFIIDWKFEDLHNPFELKDMQKAVDRIKEAKIKGKESWFFWDYDVDGVTSTSIWCTFLEKYDLMRVIGFLTEWKIDTEWKNILLMKWLL